MRLLVTLKGERYELPHHAYGVLAEIDWPQRRVVRTLHLPAPSLRTASAFMAPLTGGLCALGGRIFVAMWNFVVEVDYASFQIVNAASSPMMADLHGMESDGRHLYVTATATESLLCLDPDSLAPVWRWGPDEEILHRFAPPRPWWRGGGGGAPPRFHGLETGDFRLLHKSRSPFYRHHLNDVRWHQGALWLTTKGWFGRKGSSAVIRLEPLRREASFLVPPGGGLHGIHDGVFHDGGLHVTESERNALARIAMDGTVEHHPLEPQGYFVRGLCRLGELFLVGFTRLRQSDTPSWIMAYTGLGPQPVGAMRLDGFYPPQVGCAIHALLPSPGG